MPAWASGAWAVGSWAANSWAGIGLPAVITSTTMPNGQVGAPYSAFVVTTGDTPITWSITVGILPDGLSLNANTGQVTGTPTTAETQAFTVEATNGAGSDTQDLEITIVDPAAAGAGGTKQSLGIGLGF